MLLALALVGAACGSGDAGLDAAATDAASSGTAVSEPVTNSTDGSSTPAAETEDQPVASAHLFPDLETVNVVGGATVNLADQLAGGDTPVLLWFWAPH